MHGAGRRRKRDQQKELGGCGHAAAGIVAWGETKQEVSECGYGCRRLGAHDCKPMRKERCAMDIGPHLTFATGRLLGPLSQAQQASIRRTDALTQELPVYWYRTSLIGTTNYAICPSP